MKKKTAGLLALIALGLGGCASSPSYVKSEVIANSDRSLKTPTWVLSEQNILTEGSDIVFVHKVYLEGSGRPDACVAMARTQAVGEMLKTIKTAITSSGQVEALNTTSDPSYSALTAFLSQGNISGARLTESYWEQSMEPDSTGFQAQKRLMCAVKVRMEKSLLERQIQEALQGTPGGNPEIRRKLINAQKDFLESVGQQDAASSQPATEPNS